jgi:cytochrome c peroxidase
MDPIVNPNESNMSLDAAVARLQHEGGYGQITVDDMTAALASYVRTIRSSDSRFDRDLKLGAGLTAEETQGLVIFRGKGNCFTCHAGSNFTDERFHNTGVAWRDGRLLDEGRFVVTGKAYDHGAFKTPTLREVAPTAPYMHDGSMVTLRDVVEFYDRGGNRNPHLDSNIEPLNLSAAEKKSLVAHHSPKRQRGSPLADAWGG